MSSADNGYDMDGTGRGTPIISVSNRGTGGGQVTETLRSDSNGAIPMVAHTVSLRGREGGSAAELGGDVSSALRRGEGGSGNPMVCVALQHVSADERRQNGSGVGGDISYTLDGISRHGVAAWDPRNVTSKTNRTKVREGVANTLHEQGQAVIGAGVRRLTPTECERLQGFPDGWTAENINGPQADGPRYRQLGNAVAVPVITWIGRRLMEVDSPLTTPTGTNQ